MSGARALVRARGGDWCGSYGLVSGPGHSPKDRSLKVWDTNNGIRVHSFAGDDWRECRAFLGLDDSDRAPATRERREPKVAQPTRRVRDLLRTAAPVDLVPDAVAYLQSRLLWPLPPGCALKAHAAAPYWDAGNPPTLVAKFAAKLAPLVDVTGELVTVHVTYLAIGQKIPNRTSRKLLSGTTGRIGCAVRLMPMEGRVLAVAEGVETGLAFHRLTGLPTWACLSTALLGAFTPPSNVERLVIAADRDVAGLQAAWKLRDRLNSPPMELRLPRGADFAEDLHAPVQ